MLDSERPRASRLGRAPGAALLCGEPPRPPPPAARGVSAELRTAHSPEGVGCRTHSGAGRALPEPARTPRPPPPGPLRAPLQVPGPGQARGASACPGPGPLFCPRGAPQLGPASGARLSPPKQPGSPRVGRLPAAPDAEANRSVSHVPGTRRLTARACLPAPPVWGDRESCPAAFSVRVEGARPRSALPGVAGRR